jgi:hypothetical protein
MPSSRGGIAHVAFRSFVSFVQFRHELARVYIRSFFEAFSSFRLTELKSWGGAMQVKSIWKKTVRAPS